MCRDLPGERRGSLALGRSKCIAGWGGSPVGVEQLTK